MSNAKLDITSRIHPVILSGGSGTRLWPISSPSLPKQMLRFHGANTMLQETVLRFSGNEFAPPLVVCNEEHRFLVAEQLRVLNTKPFQCLLEPVGRNTAPAAAVAALVINEHDPNGLMLIAPSDQVITDPNGFRAAIRAALPTAVSGSLVTFGVEPSRPHTGYGYIRQSEQLLSGSCFQVQKFVEKPDYKTAESFLEQGDYWWNSGIFLFRTSDYLEALALYRPEMLEFCHEAVHSAEQDQDFLRLNCKTFEQINAESIDRAVMEHTANAALMPIDVGWSDIGSWEAFYDLGEKDKSGNVSVGNVFSLETRNSCLWSDGPVIATMGVEDLIIAVANNTVLVAKKDRSQSVRNIVTELTKAGLLYSDNRKPVYRPWGTFEKLKQESGFQVKLLSINPGASISLQYNNHRAEHWVVVKGNATVTRDDETVNVCSNQSIYIPVGSTHRLKNPGPDLLNIIEVQTGTYLGEDDIVRVHDPYARA